MQWPKGDVLHLEGVLERRNSLCNDVIRRDDKVESADDQTDFWIDDRRRLDNLVDPRVRAADHKQDTVRGVDGKRQLFEFLRAGCVRHKRDQRNARSDFGRLVLEFKVGPLPCVAEFHHFGRIAIVVAHLRRQGFVFAVEARWQRRAVNAEAFLGSVDFHLRVHAQDVAQARHMVGVAVR